MMEITVKIPYIDKVVDHVKKHKTIYISGGVVVIAGITYAIMRSKPRPLWRGVEPTSVVKSANTASQFFTNKSTINMITVLERDGRGHPGWPVQNLETKQVFLSQRQAAEAFNISPGNLSSHLNGKFPNANGLHFERVNLTPL